MKEENDKCGEIYRRGPGKFTFSCAYCTKTFDFKTKALAHIENHFTFEATTTSAKQINLKTQESIKIPDDSEDTVAKELKDNLNETPNENVYRRSSIEIVTCKVEFEDSDLDSEFMPSNNDENGASDSPSLILIKSTKNSVKNQKKKRKTLDDNKGTREWGPLNSTSRVQCDCCKNKFQRRNIGRHMMKIHINPKPSICSICKAEFRDKKQHYAHLKTHDSYKKYDCHICGAKFANKSDLLNHRRVHTGEKPYACKLCNRTFGQRGGLLTHTRTHTGEKPYNCEICGKNFAGYATYTMHLRRHTNDRRFQCEMCGKYFFNGWALRKHQIIHSGELPFKCEVCHRKFGLQCRLETHMRTHTGEKPFKCRMCDSHFAHYSGRIQHEKVLHNLQPPPGLRP